MRVAILETVKASAGFELEFDCIIIEALKEAGHEPILMVPEETIMEQDFQVPIHYLSGGKIVSYDGVGRIGKIWRSFQREYRRVKWFDAAEKMAEQKGINAILMTTATYRYLRSLKKSRLQYSNIPIYFIFLGVNPQEKPKFLSRARSCIEAKNIHLCVTTLRDDFGYDRPANVRLIKPPVMIPANCEQTKRSGPLTIGFFGHYRKGEKNIEWLLEIVHRVRFNRSVQFVLQLAPTTAEDETEIAEIMRLYKNEKRVSFITKKLIHDEWYHAIQSVDVVFLPYTAERYKYNWSAIYFTAIGAGKPVLTTPILNPETMDRYRIGELIDVDNKARFEEQLLNFVNQYDHNKLGYMVELERAKNEYSKVAFIKSILQ